MDEELSIFRDSVARFVEAEMVPNDEQWRKQQHRACTAFAHMSARSLPN
jgi:hypothetical protein